MSNIEHLRRSSPQGQRRKYQQRSGSHHLQTDRRLLRFFSQTHHVYGSVPFAVKSSRNLTLLSQGSCPSGFWLHQGFDAAADGGLRWQAAVLHARVGWAHSGIHVSGLQLPQEAAAQAEDAATGGKPYPYPYHHHHPHPRTGTHQEECEQPCCVWLALLKQHS